MRLPPGHSSHSLLDWEHVKARQSARVTHLYCCGMYAAAAEEADHSLAAMDTAIDADMVRHCSTQILGVCRLSTFEMRTDP